ncbi:MAG TPA: FAD-dependent oxidoreductase [Ktedonobacteraceae bacterium]|nr:FAD-dependent oxidoreductase [Ktedonobacteraceae bacterium]
MADVVFVQGDLVRRAEAKGVVLYPGQTAETLIEERYTFKGVRTRSGDNFFADHVVAASGAWTALLVPDLVPFAPLFPLRSSRPLV